MSGGKGLGHERRGMRRKKEVKRISVIFDLKLLSLQQHHRSFVAIAIIYLKCFTVVNKL